MTSDEFEVERKVNASKVPNWVRRSSKWDDLMEELDLLKPGEALEVSFTDTETANRARNAVRDMMNARMQVAAIRTRLIAAEKEKDNRARVFFTKLRADQIVETD